MKRFLCALTAALLLAGCVAVRAEYDFSDLTLDELYEVRAQLDRRIEALESADTRRVYESGSYRVGEELPAGDYVLVENEDAVFANVAVREDASEDAPLVMHQLINGQAVIRFPEGAWVVLSEARAFPLAQVPMTSDEVLGEGGYLAGALIAAGRYTVSPAEKAPLSSYSVYDGILGTGAQLIRFEVLHEPVDIALADGDYVELSGCTIARAQ